MTIDDIERRWRDAKIGERRDGRVCVWIECEGDPRAEVTKLVTLANTLITEVERQRQRDPKATTTRHTVTHPEGAHVVGCEGCEVDAYGHASEASATFAAAHEATYPDAAPPAIEPAPALVPKTRKPRRKAGKS